MTKTAESRMRPGYQLFIYLVVIFVALIAGSIIAGIIVALFFGGSFFADIAQLKTSSPGLVNALWILQIIGTTLPIFAAPVFFAYVVVKQPADYLRMNKPLPWQLLLLTLVIMISTLPIMEQLVNINQRLALPSFLKGLEDWMRESEEKIQKLMAVMLKMNSAWEFIKALVLIAGVTALVEELMFRGVLQTILLRWTGNHHTAILITAVVFSAFHMEFFSFLPRLMLGIFFGYFVYWTGSIWSSVWAHFINNGLAVLVTYLYQHKSLSVNPDDTHVFHFGAYVLSILITVGLLVNYRNIALAITAKRGKR